MSHIGSTNNAAALTYTDGTTGIGNSKGVTEGTEAKTFEQNDDEKLFDAGQLGREIIASNALNVPKDQLESHGIPCSGLPQQFGESMEKLSAPKAVQPAPIINAPTTTQAPILPILSLSQLVQLLQATPPYVPFYPVLVILIMNTLALPQMLPIAMSTVPSYVTNNQPTQPATTNGTGTRRSIFWPWRVSRYVCDSLKQHHCFISEEQMAEISRRVSDSFETEFKGDDDPNCVLNDFTRNLQMQCIDGKVIVVVLDDENKEAIDRELLIHNTSLPDRLSGHFVYAVSVPNEVARYPPYRVLAVLTPDEINARFHILPRLLPGPSRYLPDILDCLLTAPFGNGMVSLQRCNNKTRQEIVHMHGLVSLSTCGQFGMLYNNIRKAVPVMLVKPTEYAVEWTTFHKRPNSQIVSISLRYQQGGDLWSIEHVEEFDYGRVFFRHRLLLLPRNHSHSWSYQELKSLSTL